MRDGSPEYRAWQQMIVRCTNPNIPKFARYGGRGITVCERWHVFENFLADMGRRPSARHSLDRKDNDGPYSSDNCRWATSREQNRNRSTNRILRLHGVEKPAAAWAEEYSLALMTLISRLHRGWSDERAITTKPFFRGLRRS